MPYIAVQVNCHIFKSHLDAALDDCLSCNMGKAGTARHFHVNYGQAVELVRLQDCRQLFNIKLHIVKFRAAYGDAMVF